MNFPDETESSNAVINGVGMDMVSVRVVMCKSAKSEGTRRGDGEENLDSRPNIS